MRPLPLAIAAPVLVSAILCADVTEAALPHSYSEDFTTLAYCDTLNTTAEWSTSDGTVGFPPFVMDGIGFLATGGQAQDIRAWGDMVVVADGNDGIRMIDVTDPSNPALLGTYDTSGSAHKVDGDGNTVFIADDVAGFVAVDLTNPSSPSWVGGVNTPGTVLGIAKDGRYLHVADGTQGIKVYDVADPASPALVATYFISGTALDVDVEGQYAYYCYGPTGVVVVDVSDLGSMSPVATLDTPGSAVGVTVEGIYAYITDSLSGLQIADVSDPADPVIVGSLATTGSAAGVDIDGPYAYIANGATGSDLWMVDISDPTAPVSVASLDLPGGAEAVHIDGSHVYVASDPGGVSVVEVAQFTGPFLGTTLSGVDGGVRAVATRLYAGAGAELRIYEAADPIAPSLLGSVATKQTPEGVDVVGHHAFAAVGDSGLQVIDVSDPASPVVVGSCGGGWCDFAGIDVKGGYAYIPAEGTLVVCSVHDRSDPNIVNAVSNGCVDVAIAGRHGYYVVQGYGEQDLHSARVSGASIITLDSVQLPVWPSLTNVAVAGDLAYAAGGGTLFYVDVSDPADIHDTEIQGISGAAPLDIEVVGDRVFVVASLEYMAVSHATTGYGYFGDDFHPSTVAQDADAAGDYLFATGDAGLSFIEILQRAFDTEADEARSLSVATGQHTIRKARLIASQADSIRWALSANGGATWQYFAPDGEWYDLAAPGTDLRWRSKHQYRGLGVNPACSGLTIDWLCDFGILDVVRDVPNDQGRMARLSWTRSAHDFIGDPTQATGYAVYRRIDQWARGARVVADDATGPDRLYPPGDWEYVVTVPACCEDVYRTVVPTVCDSTLAGGLCESVFFVRALTATPGVHFDSPPDSGYSVDNLAPAPPLGLLAEGDASSVDLAWEESEEVDFDYYTVYRSTDEGFSSPELLGHTSAPSFKDDDPPQASEWWYRVTATDFAGNESVPSSAAGVSGTGVPDGVPASFALASPVPNPGARSIAIGYSVPAPAAGASVSIGVYDSAGRLVRRILDGPQPAGTHEAVWDCRDESGAEAASGVYFCRMEAGAFRATRKVIVVR